VHPPFSFEDSGRVFACHVARAQARDVAVWWWFTVSSDSNRYAPFQAEAGDTEDSVRARVVAYYDALVTRRSAPREPWRRPDRPANPSAAASDGNKTPPRTGQGPSQ